MKFVLDEEKISDKNLVCIRYINDIFMHIHIDTEITVFPGDVLIDKRFLLNDKQSSYVTILLSINNDKGYVLTQTFFKKIDPISLLKTTFNRNSIVSSTGHVIKSNAYPMLSEITKVATLLEKDIEDFSMFTNTL